VTRRRKTAINEHSQGCENQWSKLLQLWSEVDCLVQAEIAQTKGGPSPEYMTAGKLEGWQEILLSGSEVVCRLQSCKTDKTELTRIIDKNLNKFMESSKHEEETTRSDPEYLEWENW
jgi:hypothetical protein